MTAASSSQGPAAAAAAAQGQPDLLTADFRVAGPQLYSCARGKAGIPGQCDVVCSSSVFGEQRRASRQHQVSRQAQRRRTAAQPSLFQRRRTSHAVAAQSQYLQLRQLRCPG